MSNDAEAREVHATVTDSGAPWEPVNDGEAEPEDRTDLVDEDDADEDDEDDELIDADAVIIAEDSDEPNDRGDNDLDEADDDTDPGPVAAEAIVAEPVPADDTVVDPVLAEDTVAEPIPADDTVVDPVLAEDTVAEPIPADATVPDPIPADATLVEPVPAAATAAEPVPAPGPGGPKHAAAESGGARPGMPVNSEVPEGAPMAGNPEQLHERWAAIQSTFVDDPRGSVTSAADLVTEVIAAVVASAKERESGLRGEWDRDGVDTEGLRNALRSYRALLDQIATL
jgi:hypothetical protein